MYTCIVSALQLCYVHNAYVFQHFCLFRKQGKIDPIVSVERLPDQGTKRKAETKAGGQAKKAKVQSLGKLNVQLGKAPKPKPKEQPAKKPVAVKRTSPCNTKKTVTQGTKATRSRTRSTDVKSEPQQVVTEASVTTKGTVIGTAIKSEVTEDDVESATTDTDAEFKQDPNDPNSQIITVYALLDIQNEVLQEMRDLKETLRTRYYFEQRFKSKLQMYFGLTDKKIMERYARQADYNVGDELKVAAVVQAVPDKKKFLYMVQKAANDNIMQFKKHEDEHKMVHTEPTVTVIKPVESEQMQPPPQPEGDEHTIDGGLQTGLNEIQHDANTEVGDEQHVADGNTGQIDLKITEPRSLSPKEFAGEQKHDEQLVQHPEGQEQEINLLGDVHLFPPFTGEEDPKPEKLKGDEPRVAGEEAKEKDPKEDPKTEKLKGDEPPLTGEEAKEKDPKEDPKPEKLKGDEPLVPPATGEEDPKTEKLKGDVPPVTGEEAKEKDPKEDPKTEKLKGDEPPLTGEEAKEKDPKEDPKTEKLKGDEPLVPPATGEEDPKTEKLKGDEPPVPPVTGEGQNEEHGLKNAELNAVN